MQRVLDSWQPRHRTAGAGERQGHGGGSLRVFKQFVWLEVGSGKMALPHLAHQWVSHSRPRFTGQAYTLGDDDANRWAVDEIEASNWAL